MDQVLAALDATWRILLVGMLFGAGLPTIFAWGIRALAWGTGGEAEIHNADELLKPHRGGRLIAYTLFAIVIATVVAGVGYIIAHGLGFTVSFNGLLPAFTPKH
jgi:hypothetical protein